MARGDEAGEPAGASGSTPRPAPDNTRELLVRARTGDKRALTELVERDRGWLDAAVRRRMANLRPEAQTADLVQDLMVKLLRSSKPPTAINKPQLRGYLLTAVTNLLATAAGRAAVWSDAINIADTLVEHIEDRSSARSPLAEVESSEQGELAERALLLLPGDDQDLIRWRHKDGLAWAEVGRRAGLNEAQARMRCKRALAKLSEYLALIADPNYRWPDAPDDGPTPAPGVPDRAPR